MKGLLSLLFPLTVVVDVLCLLAIFVAPRLPLPESIARNEWSINLGLTFVGVSGLVLLAALLLAVTDAAWRSGLTQFQLVCLGLLGGYVLFAIVYLWRLLGGGI
jgi:hypothetical protein